MRAASAAIVRSATALRARSRFLGDTIDPQERDMSRSLRVLAVGGFMALIISTTAHAAVGPELDPSSMVAGLAILAGGVIYLIERFPRRR
jgi:uncharacterized membrane protein HdeD (DUF308 family)